MHGVTSKDAIIWDVASLPESPRSTLGSARIVLRSDPRLWTSYAWLPGSDVTHLSIDTSVMTCASAAATHPGTGGLEPVCARVAAL